MNAVIPSISAIEDVLNAHQREGGYVLLMPEYRPDIARVIAKQLDLAFYDYRSAVMSDLGWQAHTLKLSDLDEALLEESQKKGLLAFNVESLLATKDEAARRSWFAEMVRVRWPNTLLVPIAVFHSDLDRKDAILENRVIDITSHTFPEQTLISRLAM